MYKKCDFKTMKVEITTSQIATGIKIIDLTERIINTELKKAVRGISVFIK